MKPLILLFVALTQCWALDTITPGHPRIWLTPALITTIHNHVLGTGGSCGVGDQVWCNFVTPYADGTFNATTDNAGSYLLTQALMYVALHNIPGDSSDGANYDPAHHTSAQWAAQTITAWMYTTNYTVNIMCSTYGTGPTLDGCMAGSPPAPSEGGNFSKNSGHLFALVYDWLQYGTDQWGSNKAAANRFLAVAARNLQNAASGIYGACDAGSGGSIIPNDNECLGGLLMAQTMAAIAIYGDGLNKPDHVNSLDDIDRNGNPAAGTNQQFDWAMNDPTFGFRNFLAPYVNTGRGVGVPQAEGKSYGYGDIGYAAKMLLAIDTGSNVVTSSIVPNYLNETTTWMFHATTPASDTLAQSVIGGGEPAWYYMLQFGDGDYPFRPNEDGRAAMLMLGYMLGASTQGNYVRSWINTQFPVWVPSTPYIYVGYDLLFGNNPTGTATAYSAATNYATDARCTLPTSGCGMNFVSSRSDWTANATWLTFRAGTPNVRHGYEDTGNLTFYRKGKWLVMGPTKYGQPWTSAELQSTINYQGVNDSNGTTFAWKGPQQQTVIAGNVASDLAYENPPSDLYTYNQAEFGKAYQTTRLAATYGDFLNPQRIERQVFHIKPDYVVVMDRTVWRDATWPRFQLMLMTDTSAPSNASGVITSTNGTQKLFVTPLLPASTVNITNLNVSGSVFDAAYANDFIAYGAYGAGCNAVSPVCLNDFGGNPGPSGIGFYRLEVTPSGTRASQPTSQTQLNVLQGADSGTLVTPVVAITSGNYSGAHIKDSTANWVVGGSNIPAGTGLSLPVSYTYTPSVTARYHLIANLPVSATVCVTGTTTVTVQTCGSGTQMTTSSQGTLAFSEIAGALVQVNSPGEVQGSPGTRLAGAGANGASVNMVH